MRQKRTRRRRISDSPFSAQSLDIEDDAQPGLTSSHSVVENRIQRAGQLAREAASYWQTTLRGLFALPNAMALSVSSAVLYLLANRGRQGEGKPPR
jgi:hypothetical protein